MAQIETFCSEKPLTPDAQAEVSFVFRTFNKLLTKSPFIFREHDYDKVKSFSPIEMVAVCTLIAKHGPKQTLHQLKEDILGLRERLRSNHNDLRIQEACWKTAWDYIDDLHFYEEDNEEEGVASTLLQTEPTHPCRASTLASDDALSTGQDSNARREFSDSGHISSTEHHTTAHNDLASLKISEPSQDVMTEGPGRKRARAGSFRVISAKRARLSGRLSDQ